MDKKEIIAKLTKMRQQYILNRSKKREEKEEINQSLLSFRRKGHKLIVSGNSYSVRKIHENTPRKSLLLNEASEAGCRYVCQGEKKQWGDKKRGWVARPVEFNRKNCLCGIGITTFLGFEFNRKWKSFGSSTQSGTVCAVSHRLFS